MTLVKYGDVWEPDLIKENLNNSLASEIGKIKCDCEHKSRISEHQRSSARWKALTVFLILLLLILIWMAYTLGLAFGAYYAHSFATGGCYGSFLWEKNCKIAY